MSPALPAQKLLAPVQFLPLTQFKVTQRVKTWKFFDNDSVGNVNVASLTLVERVGLTH